MLNVGDSLPIFSDTTCPSEHNAYSKCIEVHFQDGGDSDTLLLNKSHLTPVILNGHLKNEPNIKVVVILADNDNPNSKTVSTLSGHIKTVLKIAYHDQTGKVYNPFIFLI